MPTSGVYIRAACANLHFSSFLKIEMPLVNIFLAKTHASKALSHKGLGINVRSGEDDAKR